MIDTHTHLYMPDYSLEGQAVDSLGGQCAAVDRAIAAGVEMMILPCVDRASIDPLRALHALRPHNTAMAMGLHPTEVAENWRDEAAYILATLADGNRYCAVGEIGIDLYWDKKFEAAQMEAFDFQLKAAETSSLPVIIHCREGLDQALEVLSDHKNIPAVFHSFGGTASDVERIRAAGDYYFGINGIVTFKNAKVGQVLPAIGIDRILTETDAPFLAPAPHRGTRNESALMPLIVEKIADCLGISTEQATVSTAQNARRLFNL